MSDPDAKKNAAIAKPSVTFQTLSPLCNDIPVQYRGSEWTQKNGEKREKNGTGTCEENGSWILLLAEPKNRFLHTFLSL